MEFKVEPETVRRCGDQISRNGHAMWDVRAHLDAHLHLGSTAGLWLQTLSGAHHETRDRMSLGLSRAAQALEGSGVELGKSADYYAATDRTSAANLDRQYRGSARPYIDSPGSYRPPHLDGKAGPYTAGTGIDVTDPRSSLNPPQQPQEFTDPVKLFNVVSDFLSPTWWINQVLDDTIGCNPLEFVTDQLIGDWEGFAKCAIVWESLSRSADAISENIDYGLRWLSQDWHGQAADQAVAYLDRLRRAIDSHRDILRRLHGKYLDVARGVWNCARALADLLKMILDNVIVAGIAVMAAAYLSWTGVGAGISLAVAALECANIMRLWGNATQLISNTQAAIEGFVGFLQSQEADTLDELTPMAIPEAYDHPNPQVGA
ncbi:hypothetical protein [Alloactinosynnema sp. L-07]|uniref:WXG100 family type VII secretion target n=1 Tax=Alloactinosynnema sp. L-07 TaxID=1653480 RepID=UPI00065EF40E|nr:hypothetical protein [Alloactinosynnema sp. L-07]CRK59622.1 hypothetical protein [Alloactinosynnema sp. L-07]